MNKGEGENAWPIVQNCGGYRYRDFEICTEGKRPTVLTENGYPWYTGETVKDCCRWIDDRKRRGRVTMPKRLTDIFDFPDED